VSESGAGVAGGEVPVDLALGGVDGSLRLLEKHVALTEGLPDLDHSTIGRVLKKTNFVLI
jgi:hypothetical protein